MGPTERPLFPLGTRPPFSMRPASRGRKCLCETGPSLKADRMKVKELRPESKVDVIDLTIRQKGAVRDFSSRGGSTGKVCDAKAVDEEGSEVSVSLWNEEIERVQANDRIRITNGWVREWRGNKQGRAGGGGEGGEPQLGGPTPPRTRREGVEHQHPGGPPHK